MKNITGIILTLLALIGCEQGKEPGSSIEDKYLQTLTAWRNADIQSYSFDYEATGFNPLSGIWRIQVVGGLVTSVTFQGSVSPQFSLTLLDAPTIDSLFTDIQSCFDATACEVTMFELNSEYPVPIEVVMSAGQEGDGFLLRNFESETLVCNAPRPEACLTVFEPVCATQDNGVRCITEPCDSTEKATYSNDCLACADARVYSYIPGSC